MLRARGLVDLITELLGGGRRFEPPGRAERSREGGPRAPSTGRFRRRLLATSQRVDGHAAILTEAHMTVQTDRTRRSFVMEEAVAILSRTPATLDTLLRGLPEGWIVANEGGETWSPFDVVGH